jgi:hypothetical protein
VQADYLAVDAEQEAVDRLFEAYLLWLFGFVLFCSSQGDVVVRYLIPHARRIADAPLDVVPQISWGNSVLASTYRGLCSGCRRVVRQSRLLKDKRRIHLRSASVRTYTFFTTEFPRFLSIRGARGLQAFDLPLLTSYSNPNYD